MIRMTVLLGFLLTAASAAEAVAVYPYRMDPRRHPDDARRDVKPPSHDELGGKMHFIAYRGLKNEGFDRYIEKDGLGDFIWPAVDAILKPDIAERVAEIKRRGLYLFDVWGWVPGGGAANSWAEFSIPRSTFELFERELGDKWLGMDNGEQDGRYVGRYADQRVPFGEDRFGQYLNFQRHFERMDYLLGNKMATLVSLNFGHYFLRENCYTMIGAETAQALPNAQVYYSWIRGAGKQYGVPWFGNVSVFNRWGWKDYPQKPDESGKYAPAPDKGTSLALMKKLLYAQIFYNSSAVGFETGLYWRGRYTKDGKDGLSPIGLMHREAQRWYEKHGDPGIMHAPVALMVDFYSGWSFPRHLYTGKTHLVWGALPYDEGDYLTDGVLDMIYPGYQDSSYFRDERGFNVDTPYGDIADCVLSDAPAWVLKRYPAVILAGRLRGSEELRDTLLEYVRSGGELCLTKGNAKIVFPGGLKGVDLGKGRITPVRGGDWGVETSPRCRLPVENKVDVPLATPYPLTADARRDLDAVLRRQMAFGTSDEPGTNGLAVVSCRRGKGEWTVCVMNNTWRELPFKIKSYVGAISGIEELPVDAGERKAVGFAPRGYKGLVIGKDTPSTIAAGAVRTFRVRTDDAGVVELPEASPVANVSNVLLALRGEGSIKRQILARPTFFRHFSGVMIDWRYLHDREKATLKEEANWLGLQKVKIVVDMSGAFNMFPDLRMVRNNPAETERTDRCFRDILEKMKIIGAADLMVAPSRPPETNMKKEDAEKDMLDRLAGFSALAAENGIALHLRQSQMRLPLEPQRVLPYLEKGKVKLAPSLAVMPLAASGRRNLVEYMLRPGEPYWNATGKAGIYLLAAPGKDLNGCVWSLHRPIASQTAVDVEAFRSYLRLVKAKNAFVVFDAVYADRDEEYRDVRFWRDL